MAMKRVREVPKKLPDATLYLNDIEELAGVFLSAFAHLEALNDGERHILFEIDNTDICDSIADLEARGGRSSNFRIRISDQDFTEISIYKRISPEIRSFALATDKQWALFGQVERIFASRSSQLRTALRALPDWFQLGLLAVTMVFVAAATLHASRRVYFASYALVMISVISFINVTRNSNTVIFTRHERSSELRSERRRDYVKIVIVAIISALLTIIVQAIWNKLFH